LRNLKDLDTRELSQKPGAVYPWIVVMLGVFLLLVININSNTFGVFFKPIAEQFGWSRGTMSGAFALRSLVMAIIVVPLGYYADRYGPRWVLTPSYIITGICLMLLAKITAVWQLYLVQGLLLGITIGGPFVCITATVAKWHNLKRGLALGITAAGSGLSSIIFPPIATKLIAHLDWPLATFILGIIVLIIGIPCSLLMKNPPLQPEQRQNLNSGSPFDAWRMLPTYLKNKGFLAIVIVFVVIGAVGYGTQNHLVNYETDLGYTALIAAGMMSVMGFASTAGRLGIGTISDRIGARKDAALCCILLGVSFILLLTKISVLMWIAAALFGAGFGGSIPLIPTLMVERVELSQLSTATGVGAMGLNLGATIGPWLAGFIFDVSGHYFWAFVIAAAGCVLALVTVLSLPSHGDKVSNRNILHPG
jgi:MFS family permease